MLVRRFVEYCRGIEIILFKRCDICPHAAWMWSNFNAVRLSKQKLFNSKSMFTMCNAALTHVEIPRLHDATELNSDGMIKLGDIHYQAQAILSIIDRDGHLTKAVQKET